MSKLGVYLAGAMSCYKDSLQFVSKAVQWRISFKNELEKYMDSDIRVYDPTTLSDEHKHDIITQNDFYLKEMDLVLVNLADIDESFGTMWEIVTAYHYNKPIITIGSSKWLQHPHLVKMTSAHFDNIEDAAKFIYAAYGS